jgi:hypothetical protein
MCGWSPSGIIGAFSKEPPKRIELGGGAAFNGGDRAEDSEPVMLKPSLKGADAAALPEMMAQGTGHHEKHGNRAKGYRFVAQKTRCDLNGLAQVHL